jgi:hypothetical protein
LNRYETFQAEVRTQTAEREAKITVKESLRKTIPLVLSSGEGVSKADGWRAGYLALYL